MVMPAIHTRGFYDDGEGTEDILKLMLINY